MKISTRVECGIIALIDIAINSENGKVVSAAGISMRQNISTKYLEQILTALKQTHLIRGQRGSRGGYVLARPANEITFKDIINALDITILSDHYIDNAEDSSCFKTTINSCLWSKITGYMQEFTSNITLGDVAEQCNNSLYQRDKEYMYYI